MYDDYNFDVDPWADYNFNPTYESPATVDYGEGVTSYGGPDYSYDSMNLYAPATAPAPEQQQEDSTSMFGLLGGLGSGAASGLGSAWDWLMGDRGANASLLLGGLGLYGNYLAQQQAAEAKEKELAMLREAQELKEKQDAVANYLEPWKVNLAAQFMGRSNLDKGLLQRMSTAAQRGHSQAYGNDPYVGNAYSAEANPFGAPLSWAPVQAPVAVASAPQQQLAHGGALGLLQGDTGGQDDKISAALSPGEYVFDADTVSALGDGNTHAGALALDKMRQNIRKHKRSASPTKIPPKSKAPEKYLKG